MNPSVTYVFPDKLGGVSTVVRSLLEHRREDGMRHDVVLTDNKIERDTRGRDSLAAHDVKRVFYSLPPENLYTVLRRVQQAIGQGTGVLVANDWIELACATVHGSNRAVIAIVHGDSPFYYNLALKHEPVVDAWIVLTERMRTHLTSLLPARADSIHLIPFGVTIPAQARTPAPGPLRALHVGRVSREKGSFDLPVIDAALRDRGVRVKWTIIGSSPEEPELRSQWAGGDVRYMGQQPVAVVLDECQRHDVLVLPTRAEGLPLTLLECGAAGVVPVISDLPSGVPEIVDTGVNGFRPAIGDIAGFVAAIAHLDGDRPGLEAMSAAVRERIARRFDVGPQTAKYQALFARWEELRRRPRSEHLVLPYGSRLDQPWIPNPVVCAIRSMWTKA